MRKQFLMITVIFTAILYMFSTPASAQDQGSEFWRLYEKYPGLQDFYPFGVYSSPTYKAVLRESQHRQMYFQIHLDRLVENSINAIWGGERVFLPHGMDTATPDKLALDSFGRWYYGEALPSRGIKTLPRLYRWTHSERHIFADSWRSSPLLNAHELAQVEEVLKQPLECVGNLARTYPETIIGFISGDEPHLVAPVEASIKLVEKYTNLPATNTINTFIRYQGFVPHLDLLTGNWYFTAKPTRDSWNLAPNLRWLAQNAPHVTFWFIPMASNYHLLGGQPVRPGLQDGNPSREELRLQFWQAVALGCKGFFYYWVGGYTEWPSKTDEGLFNAVLRPSSNDLITELSELGPIISSIGPLLLSCRLDTSANINIDCAKLHYPEPEFNGPAIDAGLLKDIKHDRYFLIPWNNDIDNEQSAVIRLPGQLVKGRKLYDLISLKETALTKGTEFNLTLGPAGGRIFLLAAPAEFKACTDTILRHKAEHEGILTRIRMRKAKANKVEVTIAQKLMEQAEAAQESGNWAKAIDLYGDAVGAVEESESKTTYLLETRRSLEQVADIISETDAILWANRKVINDVRGKNKKYLRPELKQRASLVKKYFEARSKCDSGEGNTSSLRDYVLTLVDQAGQNNEKLSTAVENRLKEIRKPLRIAFIFPDRKTVEVTLFYSWLAERYYTSWFCPNDRGELVDRTGNRFNPEDYNAVWIHQLRYSGPAIEGREVDPASLVMPELSDKEVINALRSYVKNGGGLLLSGISGLYTVLLGVEKTVPDQVCENSPKHSSFCVGLVPGPGFEKHPVFNGFPAGVVYTNSNSPGLNVMPECAWQSRKPRGLVVANMSHNIYGLLDDYAAIVEYRLGKGKVMVVGGLACDLSPQTKGLQPKGYKRLTSREKIRQVMLNSFEYLCSEQIFEPDKNVTRSKPAKKKDRPEYLAFDNWLFRTDPEDVGTKGKWYKPGFDTSDWSLVRVDSNWETQGFEDYDGVAWYRRKFTAANRAGKKTHLCFGGVDEIAVVYIDGKLAGEHNEGTTGWDKPFSLDITGFLTDSVQEHLLAVRVFDSFAAGGIWQPVSISYN